MSQRLIALGVGLVSMGLFLLLFSLLFNKLHAKNHDHRSKTPPLTVIDQSFNCKVMEGDLFRCTF